MKNKILKLICGAGNGNAEEIEKLSFIYASAGFNMIDVSADINAVKAAESGIKKAGGDKETVICVSIGLNDDIHFSKARINDTKCHACGKCREVCPQDAVIMSPFIHINETNCIGCQRCIAACPFGAIERSRNTKTISGMLMPVLNENIGCVEFHCTSEDENLILKDWEEIKSIYKGRLSICMNRSKSGDDNIISLLKTMTAGLDDVIIQADGRPMTGDKGKAGGAAEDYASSLQAVSFAQLIKDAGINADVILSGGTNSKTLEFAKLCGVNIDGIASGSYARKLVKEYTIRSDFWDDPAVRQKAQAAVQNFIRRN